MDELRARIAQLNGAIAAAGEAEKLVLERQRDALRQQLQGLLVKDPEGRAMIEAELDSLRRDRDRLLAQQVKMNFAAIQTGMGGGIEPRDVQFLRSEHDRRSRLPYLRQRIAELEELLLA